jgi:hypothetical protein
MRRAWIVPVVLVAAGCGGSADAPAPTPAASSTLSADGISVDLPDGWTGRILIGASGRPVLHAASFPVEANDTDEGMIAQEAMGINGMYLNVRDLGAGDAGAHLPLTFETTQFEPATFEDAPRRRATAAVASGGERFRVTAVSGGAGPPDQRYLDEVNDALSSLSLSAYTPVPAAAAGDPVSGYGLHALVPAGWEGGIARGQIHAGDQEIDLGISEFSAADAGSFVTGRMPLTIGPAEFVQPQGGTGYETGRSFVDAGRVFQLWVRTPHRRPPDGELQRVNALLASFHAEPGDFYSGKVDPATFSPAEGWHTGSGGPAEIQPDGQQTTSWASTIPYRDEPNQFPPHATLEALPADGIIVLVTLEQHSGLGNEPAGRLPRLSDFLDGSFEGMPLGIAARQFDANEGHYSAGLWVLFGREQPTEEQLSRAQAELDRLQLPEWPAWDGVTSAAR